eukprot:CAMPEP_0183349856 /NCGR_PEP_ID=MMETSP0164_2-20130417/13906_1 /TAXON_ID=221442 /ORGANISM="Coccolithus pelagicus ssp braarudi, Strain PLY182g" /LENGTH=452 /DNA_ID=CAMNT_0025521651 /DNA_START=409 /DNA_END=1768 /DNA_ORIENTATION=+
MTSHVVYTLTADATAVDGTEPRSRPSSWPQSEIEARTRALSRDQPAPVVAALDLVVRDEPGAVGPRLAPVVGEAGDRGLLGVGQRPPLRAQPTRGDEEEPGDEEAVDGGERVEPKGQQLRRARGPAVRQHDAPDGGVATPRLEQTAGGGVAGGDEETRSDCCDGVAGEAAEGVGGILDTVEEGGEEAVAVPHQKVVRLPLEAFSRLVHRLVPDRPPVRLGVAWVELQVPSRPAEEHVVDPDAVGAAEVEDEALGVAQPDVSDVRTDPRDRVDRSPDQAIGEAVRADVDGAHAESFESGDVQVTVVRAEDFLHHDGAAAVDEIKGASAFAAGMASDEVRVDAKAWFSAERTFISWMHLSLICAGASLALTAVGQTNANRLAGLMMMAPSIFLAIWGAYTYKRRCAALDAKSSDALKDRVGPALVVSMMTLVAISNSYLGITKYLAANNYWHPA